MEDEEYGTRRPRSRNWNTAEKFFLFEHVKNRFDIITDPRKEATSINAKRRIWEQIYRAIAKEFGPLEEHIVRGKGGDKCRTQWKNLVQAARKEYKQYMEAKMVGKRHNMTLLSRKICRLMSIDLDDGTADGDNEENDWTEDHPEFRYQPELCQELKEMARRINSDYAQGFYDNPEAEQEDDHLEYEDMVALEEEGSDSENEADDAKDEDYAPKRRSSGGRKRRRTSSGRSAKAAQPTRTSARALAAQAKKAEEERQARKRRAMQEESAAPTGFQVGGVITGLSEETQQEILNLHLTEHKKRTAMMTTEHKNKLQLLKMEKDILALQKEYWCRKLEVLNESGGMKDMDNDDDEEVDEDEEEEDAEAGPSGSSAPTSVVVPPLTGSAVKLATPKNESPTERPANNASKSNKVAVKSATDGPLEAEGEAAMNTPGNYATTEAPSIPERDESESMETGMPPSRATNESFANPPPVGYPAGSHDGYHGRESEEYGGPPQ